MKKLSIDFSKYERVAIGKRRDYLVKCPKSEDLIDAAKGIKNCKFLSVSMDEIDLRSLLKDEEYIYVNILPDTAETGLDKKYARIMVSGSKLSELYAVEVCIEN